MNLYECGELTFDANGYTLDMQTGVLKDGIPIPVPFCRECQAQPRCSKWHGDYPYEIMADVRIESLEEK